MASEIKVDTISEKTSANGVAIDSVTLKDGVIEATGDTAAGDNAAMGYTSAEGLILTGQGSTNDITIKNDADADVITIATGTTVVGVPGSIDLAGAIDVDGTANLDAVDIDGAVQIDGTVTVGVDNTGLDVKFFGATSGSYALWDESADDLNLIASGLGITTAKDLGTGIHVRTSDSGASVAANYDELVLENSGHCGMTILSGTSSAGAVRWGDSGDNDVAGVIYDHSTNNMTFKVNTAETLRLGDSMEVSTGGEDTPDVTDGGLCLDQGGDDAKILTFKSSDITHGITSTAETDTFGYIQKADASNGGVILASLSGRDDGEHFTLLTVGEDCATGASTSVKGAVHLAISKKSGSGSGGNETNAAIMTISDYITTEFIFDAEGDFFANGSTDNTYDAYDDAQLVRTWDLSHGRGVIDSKFDKFIAYNHEKLAELKLVGREEDGTPNHFINVTGMQRLHNGAIWQQYEKHERLANAMYELAKAAVGEEKANEILEKNDIKLLN